MANGSSSLTLKYAFIPSPNPIRASARGANPHRIDLRVIINNPTLAPVSLHEITIAIPMGADDSRCLSASDKLPPPTTPTDAPSPPWSISSSDETVTIKARDGAPSFQVLGASIDFTLPGIPVNQTESTVPLTITELPPSAPKAVDGHSHSLLKQPADFPIADFHAEPATLTDLDQSVTLHWTCSDQGKGYVYSVHSDGWEPKDCLKGEDCYQCQDGDKGVPTPELDQTTRFDLDVIQAVPDGDREIHATLSTTVQVVVPRMVDAAVAQKYLSGRIVLLKWLAQNATSCTILLDGNPIVTDAPVHTHKHPYPVVLTGDPGPHTISVMARNATAGVSSSAQYAGNVDIRAPVAVAVEWYPCGIAITPDGRLALVANFNSNTVTPIDVANRKADPTAIPVGGGPSAIAVTPDGKLALVTNDTSNTVMAIDVARRQADPTPIPVGSGPIAIAVTPDGRLALVANFGSGTVTVIDVAKRQADPTPIPVGAGPRRIAITPDGTLALVASGDGNNVTAIDIARRQADPTPIPVGAGPEAIAITPDSKLALIANYFSNTVAVIDIPKRQADPTPIPVGDNPNGVAITPDGKLALVANRGSNTVTVIDVAQRQAASGTIPVGTGPYGLAITPDGTLALVTNTLSRNVTVI